jgi:hypothetical protein
MKFNINNLTDAILDYMNKNEVKNPSEFPTLAFYKFVQESGLSDSLNLKLTAENDGKLKIMQMKLGSISNYLEISIKDPTVPDPADDPKNKPLSHRGQEPNIDTIPLESNSDTSLNKRVNIRRENRTQGSLNTILTDEIKEKKLNIYKVLAKYDTLSEISDNITDYETMIHFDDKKLYALSQAIYSYKEYQASLLKDSKKDSDELVIPSVLNKHMENVLNSLLSLSEKRYQQSTKTHTNVEQLADIIRGNVSFSAPSLLVGSDTFKLTGINKHVSLNNENIQGVDLGNSFLNTIRENVKNGTLNNIIDDLYKKHISEDFKEEYALKLRMTTRQKTLEERLEHEDVNNFIEDSKVKFPYVFKDNELFSYKSGVFTDKEENRTIADIFNTFKLNDSKTEDCILVDYTDSYLITEKDLYTVTPDERFIRFVGETDASVKSLATGVINQLNDNNDNMKMLKIYSLVFLHEENNQFNEMAFNEIFSYCAKNKLALYINVDNDPFDDSKMILSSTLKKVAENYKESVLFVENNSDTELFVKMESCKTDMATFIKHMNGDKNKDKIENFKLNKPI